MFRSTSSTLRALNRGLDNAIGAFVLALVVFAPWAFGSTTAWAAWTTTALALGAGLASLARRLAWRASGWREPRWIPAGAPAPWTTALALLAVAFVAYVGLSAFNARARVLWNPEGMELDYRDFRPWLPTTYDVAGTTKAFARYIALALAFWGARDWLSGMTRGERHRAEDGRLLREHPRIPGRVRTLLWTLAVSTAAMSLVGILHRLDGSRDLLWIRKVKMYFASGMFGPFPYRANGAQYLNLVWPMVLGFWWCLRREAKRTLGPRLRVGGGSHVVLLPCAALILAGVVVAGSRGGILVAGVELAAVLGLLALHGRDQRGLGWIVGGVVAASLAGGWLLAGDFLAKRFKGTTTDDSLAGRAAIYAGARRIAADFPLFGTGAESFMAIAGLYREQPSADWPAYVHDDYLETRVTFGWVGFAAVLAMLALVPAIHFRQGVLPSPPEFRGVVAVGLGGMLLHARFDFPFQVLSLLASFLVVAALFTVLAPRDAVAGAEPGAETGEAA